MPRLTVKLDEAQKMGAKPDGTYECDILAISDPTKGGKSTYVEVTFEVKEGEYAGGRFFRNCPIDGKGAGIFAEVFEKATGEELEYGPGHDIDVDTDDLIGLPIAVVNKQKEYPAGSNDMKDEVVRVLKSDRADY